MIGRSTRHLASDLLPALGLPATFAAFALERRWVPAVSAKQYRKLVEGSDYLRRSRRSNGQLLLSATYPQMHPSGLERVELTVDAGTFVARRVSIFVRDGGTRREYRLTNRLVQLIGAGSPRARFLLEAHPAEMNVVARVPRRVVRAPSALRFEDIAASPLEVEVAWALRRQAADLADEINVFPMSDGTVLVQGVVDEATRVTGISTELARLGKKVRVVLYTPSQLDVRSRLLPSPWAPLESRSTTASAALSLRAATGLAMPMHQRLEAHIDRQSGGDRKAAAGRIAMVTTHAVQRADQALFHSWALRRLATQFAPSRVQGLDDRYRGRIEDLRKVHATAIASNVRRLCDVLGMFESDSASCPSGFADHLIERSAADLVMQLLEINRLTRLLFTASDVPVDGEEAYGRLRRAIENLGRSQGELANLAIDDR